MKGVYWGAQNLKWQAFVCVLYLFFMGVTAVQGAHILPEAKIFITTAQRGVPSCVLEWEENNLCEKEGIYSFTCSSPVPFTGLSVGWLATDHNADPAEFQVAIRTRGDEELWMEWVHTRGYIGPDDSPSGLFWSYLYIPGDGGVHTDFEIKVDTPIGISLTFVRISVADASAALRVTDTLGEPLTKSAITTPAIPSRPHIILRSEWSNGLVSDTVPPLWEPEYRNITHALIHHTVTHNNPPNPAQVVYNIWFDHSYNQGWRDIGYNFLIDQYGNIYQGRFNNRLDTDDVVAGHTLGYNKGSIGLALIGQFHPAWPNPPAGNPDPRALRSAEKLLAWKFDQRGLDPLGQATLVNKFIYRIAGHRNIDVTNACPGDNLYNLLPTIRENVQNLIRGGGSVQPPTVETKPATSITETGAILNGKISNDGGSNIIERRFEWGTTPYDSDWTNWTANVNVSGDSFGYYVSGLQSGETYYFRAWAKNSSGWGQGNILSFETSPGISPPTVVSPGSSSEPGPIIGDLTPILQWNAVPNADYYALAISVYPYGSANIIYNPQQLYGTSHHVPSSVLENDKKYRWNMQAHYSGGWSDISNILYFQTPQVEAVSKPGTPAGEANPTVGVSYTYTTNGATSNLGHTLEYLFNWGDGSSSSWSTSKSASHSLSTTGLKTVTVTARCQTHTDKTNISDGLVVNVQPVAIDKASFVSETIPDDTQMELGQSFTKTWTIKNTGTTTWNSSYKLRYVSGSLSISRNDINISGTVAPNQTYTFTIQMKAPSTVGTYEEHWKLINSSGNTIKVDYSNTIWAKIVVKDTSPPAAPINLTATHSGWTNNKLFTIDWTNPSNPSGIAKAYYKLGSVPTFKTDGIYTTSKPFFVAATSEGGQPVYVWLMDGAGNIDHNNRSLVTLYYDATPPSNPTSCTETHGVQSKFEQSSVNNPNFTWTVSSDNASGIEGYYYYWGPDSDGTSSSFTTENKYDPPIVSPGTYYLRVKAKDKAGNEASSWKDLFIFILKLRYTLTTNVSPLGSGTVSPSSGTYGSGAQVSLTATPASGWIFDHWSGDASGTAGFISITVDGDKSITAHFIQITETVSSPTTISGLSITYVGKSESYTVSGASSSLGHSLQFRFDWGDDTISSWGSANQNHSWNSSGTFSIKVQARCSTHTDKVSSWSGALKNVTISYLMLTTTISPSGAGSVTKNPDKLSYIYNESVQLMANANSGYVFESWSGDLSNLSNFITITMDSNKSVIANFSTIPQITTTSLPNATEGVCYNANITLEDPDEDETYTFELVSGPSWLAIDANTGVLSGTPENDDVGTGIGVTVRVRDSKGFTDEVSYTINVLNILDPPKNLMVKDVPDDYGPRLQLTWDLSPDDEKGYVLWYRIYRSRTDELTEPIPLTQFTSIDSLIVWEEHYTVLIDSVSAGTSEYLDECVPLNNVPYYYWLQAVGINGMSEKIAAGLPVFVKAENTPSKFNLYPPYPNPFNPTSTIEYSLSQEGYVNLIISNISGQAIHVLVDRPQTAGHYSVKWNAQGMPSGIYFCTLKMNGLVKTKKLLLLK